MATSSVHIRARKRPIFSVVAATVTASAILILAILATVSRHSGDNARPSTTESAQLRGYRDIKSVTFYQNGSIPSYLDNAATELGPIRDIGFNTVWLVLPWMAFDPAPFEEPRTYVQENFDAVVEFLAKLDRLGLRAMIGLNYVGQGFSPAGIDPCTWATDSDQYKKFEEFATEFLRRIQAHHKSVYMMVFTETAISCAEKPHENGPTLAKLLRRTLGSLPHRLPDTLNDKFKIGYHDNSLVTLDWADGTSPIARPNLFDFVSMVAYRLDALTEVEIKKELALRVERFESLYPRKRLLIGELGASFCDPYSGRNQARVLRSIVSFARSTGAGFNVWHWSPIPQEETCSNRAFHGLAITRPDGSLRRAAVVLGRMFD